MMYEYRRNRSSMSACTMIAVGTSNAGFATSASSAACSMLSPASAIALCSYRAICP